jgi:hypothetical protein
MLLSLDKRLISFHFSPARTTHETRIRSGGGGHLTLHHLSQSEIKCVIPAQVISRSSRGSVSEPPTRSLPQTSGAHSRFEYSTDTSVSHPERDEGRFEQWATIRSLSSRMFLLKALFVLREVKTNSVFLCVESTRFGRRGVSFLGEIGEDWRIHRRCNTTHLVKFSLFSAMAQRLTQIERVLFLL